MAEFFKKIKENLVVRSCHACDAEALQQFFQKAAQETTNTLQCKEKQASPSQLREKIDRSLNLATEIYLGVFDEDKMIGSLFFRVQSPDHPWIKHIGEFGMIVLADHWRQGIGQALLNIMEEFALKIGVKRIEAKVRISNERGTSFYRKHGYEVEGTRKKAALINDRFEDEYYIAKLL